MFEKVAGYEIIKKEISTILGWYADESIDASVRLPRGVLLAGHPGIGKTLLMRSVKEEAPLPVYYYENQDPEDIVNDFCRLYKKVSEEAKSAVILIDELDELIEEDRSLGRYLKEAMDGLEPQNRIFFMATANDMTRLNISGLLRSGRFDRTVTMQLPTKEDRQKIFARYLTARGLHFDEEEVRFFAAQTSSCSGADIVAIVEDACLRGGNAVTSEAIEQSIALVRDGELPAADTQKTPALSVCVHEIGHAVLVDRYRSTFDLNRITVTPSASYLGACIYTPDEDDNKSTEDLLHKIEIGLGGTVAARLLLGVKEFGAGQDLVRSRYEARRLVNSCGHCGIKRTLRAYHTEERNESWLTCFINERLATKILRQCERRARRYIKAHRRQILQLAEELRQKSCLPGRRVREVMSGEAPAEKASA